MNKDVEIAQYKMKIQELQQIIKDLEEEIRRLSMSDAERADLVRQRDQKLQDLEAQLNLLQDKYDALQKKKGEVDVLYQETKTEIHTCRQTIIVLEDKNNSQDQLIQKLRA